MGTNNFMRINADKIYVVGQDYEDKETGEVISFEQWDWDNLKEFIQESFIELIKPTKYWTTEADTIKNQNRNFPQSELITIRHDLIYYGYSISFEFTLCANSGYYEAACLDFMVEIEVYKESHSDTFDSIDDFDPKNFFYSPIPKGMIYDRLVKKVNHEYDLIKLIIEAKYAEISMPIVKVGQFSNGEAVYEKANSLAAAVA